MKCPACNSDIAPGSSYCQNCGEKLPTAARTARLACPSCGFECPPEAKFCAHCGSRLAEAEDRSILPQSIYERRLITILFTDVSGFSTFSEQFDPEIVMEIMHGLYPCLIEPVEQTGGALWMSTSERRSSSAVPCSPVSAPRGEQS